MPGGNLDAADETTRPWGPAALADRVATRSASATGEAGTVSAAPDGPAVRPVMPAPPFPTFQSTPTLPHQAPGNGFESGRDSRAR